MHVEDTKSITWFYYMNSILDKLGTIEEASSKLIIWSEESTRSAVHHREWLNPKIEDFKNDNITVKSAMYELYERANKLQGILDYARKYPAPLIVVLDNAVQEQPFFMYVDRASSHPTAQNFITHVWNLYISKICKKGEIRLIWRKTEIITRAAQTSYSYASSPTGNNLTKILLSSSESTIISKSGRKYPVPNRQAKF